MFVCSDTDHCEKRRSDPASPLWGGRAEGAGGGEVATTAATPTPALRADPPRNGEGKEAE